MQLNVLTIVGVGLIGGSIGRAARTRGLARRIRGVGRQRPGLDRALSIGAIDEAFLDVAQAARGSDLVVFCTPVDRIAAQVLDAAPYCGPGTVLTDAGSTKETIVRAIDGKLPPGVAFVGSHPLAGSEKRGPEHADANLFEGRWTVLTPTDATDPAALQRVQSFWQALGSRTCVMAPDAHDLALALTSHLPHLLAAALAGILPSELHPLTATGFRDTTRIAAGDPGLWSAIFAHNRPALLSSLARLEERLAHFRTAIDGADGAVLLDLLTQAKECAMLWEIEISPLNASHDTECSRVRAEYALLAGLPLSSCPTVVASARGFLLEGDLQPDDIQHCADNMLMDPLVDQAEAHEVARPPERLSDLEAWTVLLKPGVMDPVAESVLDAARDLGLSLASVRTFRRYKFTRDAAATGAALLRKVLANDAIEQIVVGPLTIEHLTVGSPYTFRLVTRPLANLDAAGLLKLSRDGQLSLNLAEMQAIQAHFRGAGRDPTDVELETLAQTWSEHCSHKTLKGRIDFDGRRIDNLLKETIFGATQEIRKQLGADDWCVSVFEDNAGVVRFDDHYNVCFKVETHNHPSAIEPYGGANTGLGGVIRDVLGTGLGAKPVCNTDVFCFAPPSTPPADLPPGVLHPRLVMQGVAAGVRDYGNRMGIPTVNGAICFDPRYLGNPLVFCGTVGLLPIDKSAKRVHAGDLIVAIGGRTGRDGVHGATFSSIELTSESETISGGAVQIGNAITEKKVHDVLLQARDLNLYHAITDCGGAGGFSSAVGEMGEGLGATVQLDRAPLKYEGLSYTEIWISEAQERMVLAVAPDRWERLRSLCASEGVEATVLGTFEPTGRLVLSYAGQQVADLDMHFLHNGRPGRPPSLFTHTKPRDGRSESRG